MDMEQITPRILSDDPRIVWIDNFLTEEECAWIMNDRKDYMVQANIVADDGSLTTHYGRNCLTANLNNAYPIVASISERVAKVLNMPIENQENLHVMHYRKNEDFKPHIDFFSDDRGYGVWRGSRGQRLITFLMYMNEPEEGGETRFPNINLTVKPKRLGALYWHNTHLGTHIGHKDTLHESLPIIKGDKWALAKWIWSERFIRI